MLPPGAIFKLKTHQNAYAEPTGGNYRALSDPIAGFQGAAVHGRMGKGRRRNRMKKAKGIASPTSFLQARGSEGAL